MYIKLKKIFVALLLFSIVGMLILSTNVRAFGYGNAYTDNTNNVQSDTTPAQNTNAAQQPEPADADGEIDAIEAAYLEYEEITKEECIEIIDALNIALVGTAGKDVYIETEDGNKYWYQDSDNKVIPYLKLKGYDPVVINTSAIETRVPKKDVDVTVKSTPTGGGATVDFWLTLVFAAFIIFLPMIAVRKLHQRESIPTPVNQTKQKSDGDAVPKTRFSDVEGIEELKKDVTVLVDCLKNPEKYKDIGARTPKGVILYGPPGTGKTLLAKAIAGEAEVPFFSAVGSDFVEMYVGVGAKRVRELYKKAKRAAPCIVFIDEIDAVAGKRGEDSNTERDQTINALLAELDGFDATAQVITICATNRLDMLDSAFKRAGRFDLKLAVGLPDKEGRLNILKIHSANKKLADEVSLEQIAVKCSGFSGAELETLLNEAAMIAVGREHLKIDNDDIEDAFFKIVMQGNKKPRKGITETNRIVAWHEAGHTLATKLLTDDNVPSVTIIGSSSGAGGVTFRNPKEETLHSKKYMRALISVMYAGRAAEEIYQKDSDLITNGASQDIKQATSVIKEYLGLYGMGDIGMLDITQLRRDYEDIIDEASKMAKEIYNSTLELLLDNYDCLKELAERLLDKETLYEEEIDEIINKNKVQA